MEDCQNLAADGEVPITEAEMVVQLQTHLGATGMMNGKYLKWKSKPLHSCGWKPAKIWFHNALNDVDAINKLTAGEAGLTANAAIRRSNSEILIRQDMQRDLGESFDTLAMAVVAKNETFDSLTRSISDLTATNSKLTGYNAELSSAVKKLTNQLEAALKGRNGGNTRTNGTRNNSSTWYNWCDPGAYCHTCGYKIRKVHRSKNCPRSNDNPDHKSEATLRKPMGGSRLNFGFGDTPNGKLQGNQKETNIVNNVKLIYDTLIPGCANPPNPNKTTDLLDSSASVSLLGREAQCKRGDVQESNKTFGTPNIASIVTTETLELLLQKLPSAYRRAFRMPDIPHNLILTRELADAGCGIHLYKHYGEIDYEGETIYRGWRDQTTRFWRFNLTSKGGGRITPHTDPAEFNTSNGMVLASIEKPVVSNSNTFPSMLECDIDYHIYSIYECPNKEQLIKYYHASLGSHPKTTLIAASNAGYRKGCPGPIASDISKFIAIEDATEMGHMKQLQQGV